MTLNTTRIKEVAPRDIITWIAMPLLAQNPDTKALKGYGTCFLISERVALTAKHVLEYILRDYEEYHGHSYRRTSLISNLSLRIPQILPQNMQGTYVFWEVEFMHMFENTDIGLIYLGQNPETDAKTLKGTQPMPILNNNFLSQGDYICGYGCPIDINTLETLHYEESDSHHMNVNYKRFVVEGSVLKVCPSGFQNDIGATHFPGFISNFPTESGMSGGPVFNKEGHICGLISRGLIPEGNKANRIERTYIASLQPIMQGIFKFCQEYKILLPKLINS